MAFNKPKAIEAAQKLVGAGKLKEGIEEYLKIHKADAKDQNVLNTLGDLYSRINNVPEALTYYGKLADLYVSDGFLVRGIAMYKKISKLDPANTNAMERLADLYTMQGLMSEARAQYLQLAEAYLKHNQSTLAMEVMQKVLDLDPDNVRIQQRLADLYERHGQGKEAAGIYRRMAERQLEGNQLEEAKKWLAKAVHLAPADSPVLLMQARVQQRTGHAADAIATLEKIPDLAAHPEAVDVLLTARLEAGQTQAAEELAGKLFSEDRTKFAGFLLLGRHAARHKDGPRAVSFFQRIAEPALEHDPFGFLEALRDLTTQVPKSLEGLTLLAQAAKATSDQGSLLKALSGQAEVAVAGGDFARAKQLYDELVTLQPDNPDFAAQLKLMRQKLGEPGVLAEAPVAAEATPSLVEAAPPAPAPTVMDEETEAFVNASLTDIDLFSSYGMADKAIELAKQLLARVPNHLVGHEKLLDFYVGSGDDQGVVEIARRLEKLYRQADNLGRAEEVAALAKRYKEKIAAAAPAAGAPVEASTAVMDEAALHEVDLSAEWAAASGPEGAVEAPPAEAPAAPAPAFNASEAGEEISFYLAQGLLDKARDAVARYEQQFPGEPGVAQLRARIEEAAAPAAAPAEAVTAEIPLEPAPEPVAAQAPAGEGETYDVVLEAQPQAAPAAGGPMSASDFFADLAGDLDQALSTAAPPPQAAPPPPPAAKAAPAPAAAAKEEPPTGVLAEVFEEFKEEMGEVEEVEDMETHYNLGIAYKEMGLLDESISEFQKVIKVAEKQKAHTQLFQCCTLLGLCFLDKGHPQIAVKWYERALKSPGLDEESALALRYDMGVAHEQAGNKKAALDCFMEVYGVNVDYRNVGERIRELQGA